MFRLLARLVSYVSGKISDEFKQTFQCLATRNFRIYSMGQFVSLCGAWMQSVALSWLVYNLTGSAWMLGVVSFAGSLPMLFLPYLGGMAADRFNRRKLMMLTQSLATANALVLYFLTITNTITIGWVLGLGVFLGCITALETPVRQAFVVDMVEDKTQLVNTIAVNSANNNTARIVGPVMAALVITAVGEKACFLLNAISYLFMLTGLYLICIRKPIAEAGSKALDQADVDFKDLVKQLFQEPNLSGIIVLTVMMAVFGTQYQTLLPVVTKMMLHGDARLLGILSAAGGVGALIGSLTLARKGSIKRIKNYISWACLGLSLAIFLLSQSMVAVLSMMAAAVASFCLNWQLGGSNSLVQTTVHPAIRGRVMAVYSTLMFGITPFANLISGWFTERCGITNVLAVCALVLSIAAGVQLVTRAKDE